LSIAETSYRSRLLFLSLRPTINHPDPVAWGHHVFLQLAAHLAAGSYNVTVAAAAWGQEVTLSLVVDEDKTLNEAIHVNQVRSVIHCVTDLFCNCSEFWWDKVKCMCGEPGSKGPAALHHSVAPPCVVLCCAAPLSTAQFVTLSTLQPV
jgi:hypothetical protein